MSSRETLGSLKVRPCLDTNLPKYTADGMDMHGQSANLRPRFILLVHTPPDHTETLVVGDGATPKLLLVSLIEINIAGPSWVQPDFMTTFWGPSWMDNPI